MVDSEGQAMMTFDEVSMERSKGFVMALQELKNLRPQLYSAAEYCEKSYLHSEQKQMVLDNLKDYAVRALVNAVDHLGTVAYKLTDLLEQQTSDFSTVELKISCLNQQIISCQTYTDKEGLRQQESLTIIPRHHKHYILPKSTSRNLQSNQLHQPDARHKHVHARPRSHSPGTPGGKTLSWHLSADTNSSSNSASGAFSSPEESKATKATAEVFHLLEADKSVSLQPSTHLQSTIGAPTSNSALHTFDMKDSAENSKSLSAFKSFDNHGRREIQRLPVRSKSMLTAIFGKNKSTKQPRKVYVS
ncbi:Protein ABIL1 [Acorus calamus]|uniref:Protein ABIL1 n=1 Tax=Acorus calamus TaxID=4465 RepID=A0AAV9F4I0_ACOCL|nr:Protein ABIL1 [Acorus calamus]